jgi:hypothetical protein
MTQEQDTQIMNEAAFSSLLEYNNRTPQRTFKRAKCKIRQRFAKRLIKAPIYEILTVI